MKQDKKAVYALLIILLLFSLYFLGVYYPSVSDNFDYWHMSFSIKSANANHVDINSTSPGFYMLTIMISEITTIPYTTIPTLPFQSLALLTMLFIILISIFNKNSTPYIIIMAIFLILITKFGNKSYFLYWPHGIGLILTTLIIMSIIIKYKHKYSTTNLKQSTSIILIISLISLNYISYKLCFFNIILLICLEVIEYIYSKSLKENINGINLRTILTIFIVTVFTLNGLLYKSLLPRILDTEELTSSGIYKLSLLFQQNSFDPLNEYYFRYPIDVRNALMIWLIILMIGLALNTIIIIKKLLKLEELNIIEKMILGLTISSSVIFVFYSFIGLSDLSYIILSSYIAYALLYKYGMNSKKSKYAIMSALLLLLLLNSYITYSSDDYYNGIRNDQYLQIPSNWYTDFVIKQQPQTNYVATTDVFTGSYISAINANEHSSIIKDPRTLSKQEILFLLNNNTSSQLKSNTFIFNWKLDHVYGEYWQTYRSWSDNRQKIQNNKYLNSVYSSGDVSISLLTP